MKILFIIHALTGGGAERVMVTLMNGLCQRGYDVCLLTNTDVPFAYDVNGEIELFNLHQPCPHGVCGIKKRIWSYYVIREIAKKSKCDVVVSFLTDMNITVILSLLGSGIPLICSEHSNVLRQYSRRVLIRRAILYRFASVITVLTHHDYSCWSKKYPNCVRMPNPSDVNIDVYTGERNKTVLAVGRVNQWNIKGFDNLIRAWSIICQKHSDWRLQIAGDYNEEAKAVLSSIINESGAINIDFLGFRKDISFLMDHSLVYCLSSRVEGLPMALIEAMSRGCCCVAFDVTTGPSEIIRHNYSGLLVENQDIAALSRSLDLVMTNKELRSSLSLNAPNSVKQYDTTKVIDRWEHLFRLLDIG